MSVYTATPHNDVRKQIISVAAEMFHQQGIRSVTMDDIAHRLCMSKRTLYQIFADKESLLLACVIQHEEEVIKQLEEVYNNTQNVLEFLLLVFSLKLKELNEIDPLFFEDMQKYPKVIEHIRQHKNENEQKSASFLQKGVEQGVFRKEINFKIVARQLSSCFDDVVENGLIDEYTKSEVFMNTIIPYIRGCATQVGIAMIDNYPFPSAVDIAP